MPDLSRTGRVAMGVGDGVVSVDGVVLCPGGGPRWLQDDVLVYQRTVTPTRHQLEVGGVPGGPPLAAWVLDAAGANWCVAGHGIAAWWRATDGYHDNRGHHAPGWYPLAVDDVTGRVAVLTDHHAGAGLAIWDGVRVITVEPGPLDGVAACFRAGVLLYEAHGAVCAWPGGQRYDRLGLSGTEHDAGWRLGWSEAHQALVVIRLGETVARVVSRSGRDFGATLRERDGVLTVVSSSGAGEAPHEIQRYTVGPSADTIDLAAAPPVPAIGRPCWLGWFSFGPHTAPGNCRVDVVQGRPWLPVTAAATGEAVARYVSAEEDSDPDQLAAVIRVARVAAPTLPVLAYWTWPAQRLTDAAGRLLAVPDAEIVGVECYRKAHEDLALFERRCSAALERVAHAGRMAAIIAQAYSSNTTNHGDLAPLVAVYARLVAAHPHVVGVLAFSAGSGRATGWEDHPEIHGPWRALAAGIPGAPVIVRPEPPRPPVQPPVVAPPPVTQPRPPALKELPVHHLYGIVIDGKMLHVEPGTTTVQARAEWVTPHEASVGIQAPTAWQKVRIVDGAGGRLHFEFVAADLSFSVYAAPDGTYKLETRPVGTHGSQETFIGGVCPSGETIAVLASMHGPVLQMVPEA